MSWPRVGGLRAMELGTPGPLRARLNDLVLQGAKRATAGLLTVDYEHQGEVVEHVGERLALVDDEGDQLAVVVVTGLEVRPFLEVTWEFAEAEGEGFVDLEDWRRRHRTYWGDLVDDDAAIVCLHFEPVS